MKNNNNLLVRQYRYDPAGELRAVLDSARGKTEYQYTENGQLQSLTRATHHEYFTHDVAGNFLPGERTITPQFAPCNRITEQDEICLSYDQWGNVTEKAIGFYLTQRFAYDCENRLVSARTYDSGKLIKEGLYAYDSLGRRIKKQSTDFATGYTASTTFLWQGLRLLQEQHGNKRKLYIYEEDSYVPLARVDNHYQDNDIYYYHTDQIGTPLELTNEQGEIVWRANYKAWGEIDYLSINKVEQNLRYQGQYFDQETGLHYNTFRYYDPQIGRFTTQDPIGLAGGINLYQYAPNPLEWVDPWGWKCWSTARKNFWKNEAKVNGSKYSPRNQARMARGLAPKMKIEVFNPRKRKLEIKDVSMEIHHKYLPQRGGSQKAHEIWNLEKATPWGHASMDPYRHIGYKLERIIKGTNSW